MKYDTLVLEPMKEMFSTVWGFLPTLLIAFTILVGGWIVALLVRKALTYVFDVIGFDKLADKMHVTDFLKKGGIRRKPGDAINCVIYCVLMVMVIIMMVKALGFSAGSELIVAVLAYIPTVITGAVVLIIGMYLARFVSVMVYAVAKNTDMPIPAVLARLTKIAIVTYVAILYLIEIGFVALFSGASHTIFIGGVVFALALSFGLAGRDVAASYLEGLRAKKTPAK